MTPDQIEFWHWWVLAIVLVLLEVFTPAFVFMWLGVAAGVVGLVLLAVPEMTWQVQGLIFALLSVSSIVGWRAYRQRHPAPPTDHPELNRRGYQYVGKQFTLEGPIVNGSGVIRIGDTRWKVSGEDLPAGTQVRVTGAEGTVLQVEKDA